MRKGLVAGTFDPVTLGHIDVITRAARLCDQLDIGIFRNLSKNTMFTAEQRLEMLKASVAHLDNVRVFSFDGHLATYVLENGYDVVFRGLRSVSNFDYEIGLAQVYGEFYKGRAETVYLMTDPAYSYISSTVIRENYVLGAEVSQWMPAPAYDLMKTYK